MKSNLKELSELPEIGLSLTFFYEFFNLDLPEGLIDAFEIEPQIFCIRDSINRLKYPKDIFEAISNLPQKKIVHSIGAPVGGTRRPEQDQIKLINYACELFGSPWVSDHLSFNVIDDFNTGFFLPPFQTEKGLEVVVDNILFLQKVLDKPFIIETGVNYFKPNFGEIPDSLFLKELCDRTGCGILLDIHNLFANQLNGRESIDSFLKNIPLDKVIEIHIAGGQELNGLWVDSHSGNMDERLISLTSDFLPDVVNLKAITYEIFHSYVSKIGKKGLVKELEKTRKLWENRARKFDSSSKFVMPKEVFQIQNLNTVHSINEWETTLGYYIADRNEEENLRVKNFLSLKDQDDRINLYRELVKNFRGSMLVSKLKNTIIYLSLVFGKKNLVDDFLEQFWKTIAPEQFIHKEILNFSNYLKNRAIDDKWVYRLLNYEVAQQESFIESRVIEVIFDVDPRPMFIALANNQLPENFNDEVEEEFVVIVKPELHKHDNWEIVK